MRDLTNDRLEAVIKRNKELRDQLPKKPTPPPPPECTDPACECYSDKPKCTDSNCKCYDKQKRDKESFRRRSSSSSDPFSSYGGATGFITSLI